MSNKYRVGIIGFAQMHVTSIIKSFNTVQERIEWVGGADTKPIVESISNDKGTRKNNIEVATKICPLPKIFEDYHDLLEEKPEIVIVCAENSMHGEIAEEVLLRGIHVVIEKPMAVSLQDAFRMARASEMGKAKLIVNWPVAWWPSVHLVEKLVKEGTVGKVFKFHYRNRDSFGPFSYGQNMTDLEKSREWWYQSGPGGGAMLDYCCYGCCLSRLIIGEKPVAAYGLKANVGSRFAGVDDYATMTIKYPEAIAILEGTWATLSGGGIPTGPIVFGNKGTIVSDRYDRQVKVYTTVHATQPDQVYEAPLLPENRDNIGKEVINHLDTGEPLYPILDLPVNLDAMAALDAGIRSAYSGNLETTGDRFWTTDR